MKAKRNARDDGENCLNGIALIENQVSHNFQIFAELLRADWRM
jgi:hypothetical protein